MSSRVARRSTASPDRAYSASRPARRLTRDEAYTRLGNYLLAWHILDLTGSIALEAARGVRDHGFSYWDAQIWATARLNGLTLVLSEDFSPGAVVEGVRFVNPFEPSFQISAFIV